MQHCKRRNFPAVIQCVPQHQPVLLSLLLLSLLLLSLLLLLLSLLLLLLLLSLLLLSLLLLLLLLLLLSSLPPRLLGKVWLPGAADEVLRPPLHFI